MPPTSIGRSSMFFTGWPAEYHGIVLDTLDAHEADRMVDIVNLNDYARRGQLRPLQ